jgi:hypothetical protein
MFLPTFRTCALAGLLTLGSGLAVLGAAAGTCGPAPAPAVPAPAVPAPELADQVPAPRNASPASTATLETQHFEVAYDPARVTREEAEEAARHAEAAWERCAALFGTALKGRLRLDLTPSFAGATGFAKPGDPDARDPARRPLVGLRYPDLEYLGLTAEYVLAHEVAHLFSGDLAATSLGEGIADWAAGHFSGIPMRPWWGTALREADLWIDPDALFITGDFPARPEVDEVIRTAQYVQSGLLVRFLVERFGWADTAKFAEEYGRHRGPLISNEDRKDLRPPRRRPEGNRPARERSDPRLPPHAESVRAVFERRLGQSWERLRDDWLREMERDSPPPGEAERLVLAQRLYGAVRNYEMWLREQKPAPDERSRQRVREAFVAANRALAAGDVDRASRGLRYALGLVDQLRRPRITA